MYFNIYKSKKTEILLKIPSEDYVIGLQGSSLRDFRKEGGILWINPLPCVTITVEREVDD